MKNKKLYLRTLFRAKVADTGQTVEAGRCAATKRAYFRENGNALNSRKVGKLST